MTHHVLIYLLINVDIFCVSVINLFVQFSHVG